ncbi:hypothetical protein HDV57DRAFT_105875 [Trichoderma longibrachiatum]|uniref:Uncharacterized protein n=1 Tax=Trichoderma longibrachiatum ATCC 18648 TaxID=983965 RepID=A0A2T4C948_TRILO|nr:hypothetical protein M440DRAFT_1184350 [Trichoderma longibrachiatum ATCC 18648]
MAFGMSWPLNGECTKGVGSQVIAANRQYLSLSVAARLLRWRNDRSCGFARVRQLRSRNTRLLLTARRRERSIFMLTDADKTIQERPSHTRSSETCRKKQNLRRIPSLHATVAALPAQLVGASWDSSKSAQSRAKPAEACYPYLPPGLSIPSSSA